MGDPALLPDHIFIACCFSSLAMNDDRSASPIDSPIYRRIKGETESLANLISQIENVHVLGAGKDSTFETSGWSVVINPLEEILASSGHTVWNNAPRYETLTRESQKRPPKARKYARARFDEHGPEVNPETQKPFLGWHFIGEGNTLPVEV